MTRLGALDAAWLHMDRPENPMMITGLLWFDGEILREDLALVLQERLLATYPRFTQRVVDPVGPLPARWEADPEFHLDHHLHAVALPDPGDRAALQDLVSDLASTQLDLRRSPWQFHLVQGFEGGSALVGRIHHCMADGIALARVLLGLTDGSGALPPTHPAVRRRGWTAFPRKLAMTAVGLLDDVAETLLHRDDLARALDLGLEGVAEVEHLAFAPPDAKTPLRAPLGTRKRVAWADPISLAAVKQVGKAHGCTVNDVLVSVMAGALGDHLRAIDAEVPRIRVFVPVNLRPLDEPVPRDLGNEFALVMAALPVGETDPLQRLHAVHAEMSRLKRSVEPAITYAMFQVLGATPRLIEEWIVEFFGHKGTAVLTNVPGPRETVTMAGVPVKGVMVWVPQSGPLGLGLSIFSYAGQVTVGVAADANCLPDPGSLANRFAGAFTALVDAT